MLHNIENSIIQTLLINPVYFSKVFSHLKPNHFSSIENQEIFKSIKNYYAEYQEHPKPKEVGISLKNIKTENLQKSTIEHFKMVMKDEKITNLTFIIDETQNHVQHQEFVKAILEGAEAVQKGTDLAPVYGAMGEALKINFDADTGMKYSDLDRRLEYYKKRIFGYETGVKTLDEMLGGFRPKTLNVVGSVSHGGKSLFLASCASHLLLQKKNILFLTLEMSEEETAKRIDANVLDIDINTFKSVEEEIFQKAYNSVKDNLGTLVVKEYSSGMLDVLKLESLLGELLNEDKFIPDIIFVDYLTLMKSTRVLPSIGTYQYYKMIAEELHGFAKKWNIPVVTAAQLNRGAYGNKDSGIESIADSLGIAQTADVFFSIIRSKEMDELNQVLVTFQKNRNTGNMGQMFMGIDYPKMRYYDISGDTNVTYSPKSDVKSNFDDLDGLDGLNIPW